MKKAIVFGLLIFVLIKFGGGYLVSPQFQKYGDEKNAQWTCHVNNFMGNLMMILSRYQQAREMFTPVLKRCEKSPMAEEAAFRIAKSFDAEGRVLPAIAAYEAYVEKFPKSRRSRLARKSIDLLKGL